MATVKTFEELLVWQKARLLVKQVYSVTNEPNFTKDFGLKDQIRRAAVSVASNISEGFERQTTKEFIQFLYIAKGSVGELRTQTYLAFDLEYIDKQTFEKIINESVDISNKIGAFIVYLKTTLKPKTRLLVTRKDITPIKNA